MEVIKFLNHNVEIIRKAGLRRLTIYMHPDNPLRVRTNRRTTQKQISDFLQSKQKWIEKNISRFRSMQTLYKTPEFKDGGLFPFLGEQKYFRISSTERLRPYFQIEEGFLVCYQKSREVSNSELVAEMKPVLRKFYRVESERYLKDRLNHWVQVTSLKPKTLSFRANKSRWGSCSSVGHITLNWKLVCQSKVLIDYVIVHELCHLKYMNHSENFWNSVSQYFPEYKVLKKILNDQQYLGNFLD